MDTSLHLIPTSSLEKVFADEAPVAVSSGTALRNERFGFQVAWYWSAFTQEGVAVTVTSSLAAQCRLYQVGLVPSELPNWPDHDAHVLRTAPGLFPDPLLTIPPEGMQLLPNQWRAVWVEVDGSSTPLSVGLHEISVGFTIMETGCELGRVSFALEVLPAELPAQTLMHTQWFHADCLATWYGVPVFSEAHWTQISRYVKVAVEHGINTLLTPLFTPPLDTAVGAERPTVQLVDVWLDAQDTGDDQVGLAENGRMEGAGDDRYRFGFDRLRRWMDMADGLGIRFFEMSHLFTQWGAAHAPKIIARIPAAMVASVETAMPTGMGSSDLAGSHVEKQIFGWATDASGPAYTAFLDAFLPALNEFLKEAGYADRVLFHISDEPSVEHIDSYRAAAEIIRRHAGPAPVMDALSDFAFYENGLVANPIPANNHIGPFLDAGVPNLWTYYCCAQNNRVSNRFFSMPSARNRILGMQLFRYDIKGFLHWGYNFWNTRLSVRPLDPFRETDAGGAFPSGDAFLVYPGPEGPIPSLRMKVLAYALQDLRALQALSARIGKRAAVQLLEQDLAAPITFDNYPRDATWLLQTRERINRALVQAQHETGGIA